MVELFPPCQPHGFLRVPLRGGLDGLQSPPISMPTPSLPLLATCFSGTTKFGVLGRKRSHVFQSKPWTGDCMCPLSGFVAGCLTDLTGSGAFPDLRFGVEQGRSEAAAGGLVRAALGAVHLCCWDTGSFELLHYQGRSVLCLK